MHDLSKYKVVITDCMHLPIDVEKEVLGEYGIKPELYSCSNEDQVISAVKDADAVIVHFAPISKRVIDSMEKVQVIAKYGVGVDNIDIAAATAKKIPVCNVQNYCTNEVADHALGMLLAATRKIIQANELTRNNDWEITNLSPVEPFEGRIVGLVGYGAIGSAFAKRVRAMGCRVLVFDPFIQKEKVLAEGNEVTENLDDIWEKSDFISLHIPLTDKTKNTVDEKEFKKMKKSCIIINVSRGKLINERALYEALKKREIRGAALDVFEIEPPPKDHPSYKERMKSFSNPLYNLPPEMITLTPHMAWYSTNSYTELKKIPAQEVIRVLQGGMPKNLLNKEINQK